MRTLAVSVTVLMIVFVLTLPAYSANDYVDSTQARAMLQLLRSCSKERVAQNQIHHVVGLPGTLLIIGQQNVSRRITSTQYEAILSSACKGEVASIAPSEPGARGEKGVQGLVRDVAPSLIWGREHVPELQSILDSVTRAPDFSQVVPLAAANLPERVTLAPKLFFVMGGRAGAAASDDGIYIDLLQLRYRNKESSGQQTAGEMVDFFAHETHHVGYEQILYQRKPHHLSQGQAQAWNFLTAVLMEGSATLLINARGDWSRLENMDHLKPDLARLSLLMPKAQELLARSMKGHLDKQQFDDMESLFFGEGFHATGARILGVILRARGKKTVLEVMDKPTTLLKVYNECATQLNESFRFKPRVADALRGMDN
jgi:hypothetical protein